jgi:high-affinity iron transporter
VAAGLLSRGVWSLENNTWNHLIGGDASETGSGPGSYDIRQSVWHVNCCSPSLNGGGGWGIFNTIGWTNSATYGSVISYILYWLAIILWFVTMGYKERHGKVPLLSVLGGNGQGTAQAASESSGGGSEGPKDDSVRTSPRTSEV